MKFFGGTKFFSNLTIEIGNSNLEWAFVGDAHCRRLQKDRLVAWFCTLYWSSQTSTVVRMASTCHRLDDNGNDTSDVSFRLPSVSNGFEANFLEEEFWDRTIDKINSSLWTPIEQYVGRKIFTWNCWEFWRDTFRWQCHHVSLSNENKRALRLWLT